MEDKAQAVIAELPRLRRYAFALLRDGAAADDLVQDTVERALTRLHLWRSGTNMRGWLFTIMHNLHVNAARRRHQHQREVPLEGAPVPSVSADPPIDALRIRDAAAGLDKLPIEQRQVVLLVALEGMSYRDVAGVTGTPIGTVMSRLARGRESLRRIAEGDDPPVLRRVK